MNLLADITPTTGVSLTVAGFFSVAIALVGATWRISALLNRLDRRFDDLERRTDETWSLADMRAWVRLLDKQNAAVQVPDPDLVAQSSEYRKHGSKPPL